MTVVAFATSLILAVGAPVDPVSAAEHARLDQAARTVAEALAASQDAERKQLRVATEPAPTPVAEGTIDPGEPSTVEVDEAAATVDFSGFEVDEQLDVTVSTLSDAAVTSAETELGATVVSTPFETPLGAVGAWILGNQQGSATTYGYDSSIVQGLRQQLETQAAREAIAAGAPGWSASYSSHDEVGDAFNLPRDICTAALWNCLGGGNETKAILGSYDLVASPVYETLSGELIAVQFRGSNTYTLGSALGFPPVDPLLDAWNRQAIRTGDGLPIEQTFEWTEPLP